MKRRNFLKAMTAGAAGAAATVAAPYVHAQKEPTIRWRMATSWPTSLATLYGGAQDFAKR